MSKCTRKHWHTACHQELLGQPTMRTLLPCAAVLPSEKTATQTQACVNANASLVSWTETGLPRRGEHGTLAPRSRESSPLLNFTISTDHNGLV